MIFSLGHANPTILERGDLGSSLVRYIDRSPGLRTSIKTRTVRECIDLLIKHCEVKSQPVVIEVSNAPIVLSLRYFEDFDGRRQSCICYRTHYSNSDIQ